MGAQRLNGENDVFVGFNRCLCLEWRNDKGRRVEKADRVGLKLVRVMRICTPNRTLRGGRRCRTPTAEEPSKPSTSHQARSKG